MNSSFTILFDVQCSWDIDCLSVGQGAPESLLSKLKLSKQTADYRSNLGKIYLFLSFFLFFATICSFRANNWWHLGWGREDYRWSFSIQNRAIMLKWWITFCDNIKCFNMITKVIVVPRSGGVMCTNMSNSVLVWS